MPINYFCAGVGFMGVVFGIAFGYPRAIVICALVMFLNLAIAGSHQRDSN